MTGSIPGESKHKRSIGFKLARVQARDANQEKLEKNKEANLAFEVEKPCLQLKNTEKEYSSWELLRG